MAIIVTVDSPQRLLAEIKEAVDGGTVTSWHYDADGDFTHSTEQWKRKAWFRPVLESDKIVFRIITPRNTAMSRQMYAIYHSRFVEMLLDHFDEKFSRVVATALPAHGDLTKA